MARSVIFDIDGTLSDVRHRLHYVSDHKRDWNSFFAEAGRDPVHVPIRDLALILAHGGLNVILVSGRPESIRSVTESWLAEHGLIYSELYMRPDGDYRPDYVVKSQILDSILGEGHEILFTVDDRTSVVNMWRARGITCLQCRDWDEARPAVSMGLLSVMVGPSGAGKSTWLRSEESKAYGIDLSHVLSSDQIRHDLCGDFRDQTKNDEVFAALHAAAKARLAHGLPTVVDATNLRRRDRLAVVALTTGAVRYFVIDRPEEEKRRDAGWRADAPGDLISRHAQIFGSQLKDILAGDSQPNVSVIDLRRKK